MCSPSSVSDTRNEIDASADSVRERDRATVSCLWWAPRCEQARQVTPLSSSAYSGTATCSRPAGVAGMWRVVTYSAVAHSAAHSQPRRGGGGSHNWRRRHTCAAPNASMPSGNKSLPLASRASPAQLASSAARSPLARCPPPRTAHTSTNTGAHLVSTPQTPDAGTKK